VNDDLILDLDIAPKDARQRLAAAINRKPRRMLGVLKVENEFVGVVESGEFEIWERRQHAVHVHGRIDRSPVGSRIGASFSLTPRARILLVIFFALYVLLGAGIISRVPDATSPIPPWIALIAGGLALAGLFLVGARRQRNALQRFVTATFAKTPDR
jgi:MYXO-CTERM domain-containing protein